MELCRKCLENYGESIFWESLGCGGDPGVPLGLLGEIGCIYSSNFPGTKGDPSKCVAEMNLGWINTIVQVQKTLKNGVDLKVAAGEMEV